jgi:hypothetical protein
MRSQPYPAFGGTSPDAASSVSAGGLALYYFPRNLFFCFFTFKLTVGAFAPVPRETKFGHRIERPQRSAGHISGADTPMS